jgi:hypothetical protein
MEVRVNRNDPDRDDSLVNLEDLPWKSLSIVINVVKDQVKMNEFVGNVRIKPLKFVQKSSTIDLLSVKRHKLFHPDD